MKKNVSPVLLMVLALTIGFLSCNKSGKLAEQDKPAIIFKTDADRDGNSAALANMIADDKDWKALKQINYEFLDVVVKSNVPISSTSLNASNPALQKLYSKEYLVKFDEAKKLAGRLKEKYFQNSQHCASCETMTEAKWKLFAEQIKSFRADKASYDRFAKKLGVKSESTQVSAPADEGTIPNCNNWRFTLCSGACVVTAPTVVVFAACMAMCVAEFC